MSRQFYSNLYTFWLQQLERLVFTIDSVGILQTQHCNFTVWTYYYWDGWTQKLCTILLSIKLCPIKNCYYGPTSCPVTIIISCSAVPCWSECHSAACVEGSYCIVMKFYWLLSWATSNTAVLWLKHTSSVCSVICRFFPYWNWARGINNWSHALLNKARVTIEQSALCQYAPSKKAFCKYYPVCSIRSQYVQYVWRLSVNIQPVSSMKVLGSTCIQSIC